MFILRRKKNRDKGRLWEEQYMDFRDRQYEYLMKKKAAENTLSDFQKKQLRDMKIILFIFGPLFFIASLWNLLIGAAGGLVISGIFFLVMFRRNFIYSVVPAFIWGCTNAGVLLYRYVFTWLCGF